MKKVILYLLSIIAILALTLFYSNTNAQKSQSSADFIKGNQAYKNNQYQQAEEFYRKAISFDSSNVTANFNLAAALFKQNKSEEALKLYEQLLKNTTSRQLLAEAWYDIGVIFSGEQKLEESIDAYKNALRNKPDDKEARENLQKALLELKAQKNKAPKNNDPPQQPKPQQSKLNQRQADQRLKQLQQKEKKVQDRVQQDKIKGSGSQTKDW